MRLAQRLKELDQRLRKLDARVRLAPDDFPPLKGPPLTAGEKWSSLVLLVAGVVLALRLAPHYMLKRDRLTVLSGLLPAIVSVLVGSALRDRLLHRGRITSTLLSFGVAVVLMVLMVVACLQVGRELYHLFSRENL